MRLLPTVSAGLSGQLLEKGKEGLEQFTGSVPAAPWSQKRARERKIFFIKQESVVRGLAAELGSNHRLQNRVVLHVDEYN